MKRYVTMLFFVIFFHPPLSAAEHFLEAPVFPSSQVIKKTDSRLELNTTASHDDAVAYYREALRELKDIKFREWSDATYIEDDGSRPWHSITLSKGDVEGTRITVVKDNWTWILGTLFLRYVGVFVVLMILFIGMSLSGKIISGLVEKASKDSP